MKEYNIGGRLLLVFDRVLRECIVNVSPMRNVHGAQTKFYKRLPKMGRMKNAKFKLELIPLNVGKVHGPGEE